MRSLTAFFLIIAVIGASFFSSVHGVICHIHRHRSFISLLLIMGTMISLIMSYSLHVLCNRPILARNRAVAPLKQGSHVVHE